MRFRSGDINRISEYSVQASYLAVLSLPGFPFRATQPVFGLIL
jgi:hypothetical protein